MGGGVLGWGGVGGGVWWGRGFGALVGWCWRGGGGGGCVGKPVWTTPFSMKQEVPHCWATGAAEGRGSTREADSACAAELNGWRNYYMSRERAGAQRCKNDALLDETYLN